LRARVTPRRQRTLAAVVEAFGPGVLRADGSLDRAALGRIVFVDPAALARLESMIHPAVRPRLLALVAAAELNGAPAVVIEAIKLVEGGLAALCDEVWLITCDPTAQRARLAARAASAARRASDAARRTADADTAARIAAQGDLVARLSPFATRVIDTSGSIARSARESSPPG
jgi:dephospho-CoA kinase